MSVSIKIVKAVLLASVTALPIKYITSFAGPRPTQQIGDNVWTRPHVFDAFKMISVNSRMTIIRNPDNNELILYNPVPMKREELDKLGKVKYIIVSNTDHHKFITSLLSEFKDDQEQPIILCAQDAKKTVEDHIKRKKSLNLDSYTIHEVFQNDQQTFSVPSEWKKQVEWKMFGGLTRKNDILLYHKPSKKVAVTDVAVNFVPEDYENKWCSIFLAAYLAGTYKRFGVQNFYSAFIKDKKKVSDSLEDACKWDFDGMILGHGPLQTGFDVKKKWKEEWSRIL
ncbi:srp54 [Acrasis kona]|uniref:Srp54 n=1 Tax=Acrasis kona TaxID=1008807 RepID=A0AAW2Z608_9EUKA